MWDAPQNAPESGKLSGEKINRERSQTADKPRRLDLTR